MFELIFGTVWTVFTGLFAFLIFGTSGGSYTVNGVPVSEEEFKSMLMPKLFIGLFLAIGIFLMIKGGIKVLKNMQTKIKGEECYGRILAVERNGTYVNERPMYKAEVFLYCESEGESHTIWEDIGFNPMRFEVGSFVKVLYYNGDINFDEFSSNIDDLSEGVKQYLLSNTEGLVKTTGQDRIEIDGVTYIREDSIDR